MFVVCSYPCFNSFSESTKYQSVDVQIHFFIDTVSWFFTVVVVIVFFFSLLTASQGTLFVKRRTGFLSYADDPQVLSA